jgi:helicase MOV-10
VIVEAISQLVKRPDVRILACAPSNSAADLIAQRMGVSMDATSMFRLNAVSRAVETIPPPLLKFCSVDAGHCTLLAAAVLRRFKLVVSTCISAATLYSLGCDPGHFTHVLIDEAGHATEPEAFAALCGLLDAKTTRVVLAGDPQQLGPIIRSPLAVKHGLAMSLLERLLCDHQSNAVSPYHRDATHPFPAQYITKLLLNYRSHPAILETPNRLFYENELIASADRLNRESLQRWPVFPVAGFPLLLHHLVGKEDREGESPSWFNALEAQTVVEYIAQLLNYKQGAVSFEEIGVITPYVPQQ